MRTPSALLAAAVLMAASPSFAATCSCAAVPLLGSMESSAPESGVWIFNTSVEYHDIDDLVAGTDDVNDETGRRRESQSLILEGTYGFNDRWAVSALVSAIEHSRTVGASSTTGRGFGDGLVMLRYTPQKVGLTERVGLSVGLGLQVPIGDDDQTDIVTLAEDMQPSTGAWGTVLWGHASRSFRQDAKAQVYSTFTYRRAGENDRDYRFGDAWSLAAGTSYQTDSRWSFSGQLKYRTSKRNERNGERIPNTGGEWLDFEPSAQFAINDNLAAQLTARLPVWRDLNDALQFTTSYAVTFSMSYVLYPTE